MAEADTAFLADLDLADDQVSIGESDRERHATDEGARSRAAGVVPDAVVWPESTADVSVVLAAATDRGVPVTPYAAGTGLEGNAVPAHGGISLDLTRMDAIREYRPDDFRLTVGPGVIGSAVDEHAAGDGLFFPPLPSSGEFSTVGGMIATDASGMKTVKYGKVSDWVLGLEAVLADGSVVSTGGQAVKTSSGYNLTDLLIGSEGTLAVVTEATLELAGRPEQIRGGRAIFDSLDDATAAVFGAVRSGVDLATIELIDGLSARMANRYLGTDLPDAPMTFVEFHTNHGISEEIEFCRSIFEAHDLDRFEMADKEEMDDLWEARRELAYAVRTFDPDLQPVHPGDVTVPISEYPAIIRYAKELAAEYDLVIPCFGHAGDVRKSFALSCQPEPPVLVTATSTTPCWSIPTTPSTSNSAKKSTRRSCAGPSTSGAPRRANTGSDRASASTSSTNMARKASRRCARSNARSIIDRVSISSPRILDVSRLERPCGIRTVRFTR